jgi:hypothetical protein
MTTERLKQALDKRDKLNTTLQRLKGRLEKSQQDRDSIISEIRDKNLDPENLDQTISVLQEKYTNLLQKFEEDLNTLQNNLTQYMEKK